MELGDFNSQSTSNKPIDSKKLVEKKQMETDRVKQNERESRGNVNSKQNHHGNDDIKHRHTETLYSKKKKYRKNRRWNGNKRGRR